MPLYKTSLDSGHDIGIYSAQRPSVAACKAFSAYQKKSKTNEKSPLVVRVVTEGKTLCTRFQVVYAQVTDPFLGTLMRPVATQIKEKLDTTALAATAEAEVAAA